MRGAKLGKISSYLYRTKLRRNVQPFDLRDQNKERNRIEIVLLQRIHTPYLLIIVVSNSHDVVKDMLLQQGNQFVAVLRQVPYLIHCYVSLQLPSGYQGLEEIWKRTAVIYVANVFVKFPGKSKQVQIPSEKFLLIFSQKSNGTVTFDAKLA